MIFRMHKGWAELRFVGKGAVLLPGDQLPTGIDYFTGLFQQALCEARSIEMAAFMRSLYDTSWQGRAAVAEGVRTWLETLGPTAERTLPVFRPIADSTATAVHTYLAMVEEGFVEDDVQARPQRTVVH